VPLLRFGPRHVEKPETTSGQGRYTF
jgi:hypothetical protein